MGDVFADLKAKATERIAKQVEAATPAGDVTDPHQATFTRRRPDGSVVVSKEIPGPGGAIPALLDPRSDTSRGFSWRGDPDRARHEHARNLAMSQQALGRAAPTVDTREADAARQQQMGLAGRYREAIGGGGPSLAGYQMGQALGSAGQAAAAQAAASGGGLTHTGARIAGGGAAAERAAMLGLASAAGQAGMQSGATRLQETGQYRDQYGKLMGGMRGADIGQAMGIAGIQSKQRDLNDAEYARLQDRAIGIMEAQTTGDRARGDLLQAYNDMHWRQADAAAARARGEDEATTNAILQAGATAATVAGMAASDERLKTNVRDGGSDARAMLDSLSPKSFQYKPGIGESPDQRVGIMAQDLEKSKMGAEAIRETPIGKGVDVKRGLGLALAGLADVNRRLNSVEKK